MIDFEKDAASGGTLRGAADDLRRVGKMADALTAAQQAVGAIETDLEAAEKKLRQITREDFPEVLREVGLTEVVLQDKRTIVMTDEIDCGIPEAHKPAAFKWLRGNNFEGLIKVAIEIEFSRGEAEQMRRALQAIREHFATQGEERDVKVIEAVHHQTLKSFLKEQRAAGKPPPDDLFGVFPYASVDVKHPKNAVGFKLKRIYTKKK